MLLVYIRWLQISVSSTRIKCLHVHFPLICSSCSALIAMLDSLSFSVIRVGSCTTYRALSIGRGALHFTLVCWVLLKGRNLAFVIPFPLLSSGWPSWGLSIVTFSRFLFIHVGSIPLVIECVMLPVLPAFKTQHGSVVVVVVRSVGKWATHPRCGLWLCWGSVPLFFSFSAIFPSHFHRLWFGGLCCQVLGCSGTCLWGIIGSYGVGPVWVVCHVLPWIIPIYTFLARVRCADSSPPLSNVCQVAGVRYVCPDFLFPSSSWCESWCTVVACWCVGLQSGHTRSLMHTLCGSYGGSQEP